MNAPAKEASFTSKVLDHLKSNYDTYLSILGLSITAYGCYKVEQYLKTSLSEVFDDHTVGAM
jgi:hypothetical protein